jgi:galactokinase/mevalonate kinase-like predicted kinase
MPSCRGLNYISFHQDGSTQVESLNLDAAVLGELQSNLMFFFTGSAQHSNAILREQEDSPEPMRRQPLMRCTK